MLPPPAEEPLPIIPAESYWFEQPASRTPAAETAARAAINPVLCFRLYTLQTYTPGGIFNDDALEVPPD